MRGNRFAAREYGDWLCETRPLAKKFGYEILDLFYWEQKMATWQAQSQLEFDIAQVK